MECGEARLMWYGVVCRPLFATTREYHKCHIEKGEVG